MFSTVKSDKNGNTHSQGLGDEKEHKSESKDFESSKQSSDLNRFGDFNFRLMQSSQEEFIEYKKRLEQIRLGKYQGFNAQRAGALEAEINGKLIQFEEFTAVGDGSCGFYVLGMERTEVAGILLSLSNDEDSRKELESEIINSLKANELGGASTETSRKLYQAYIRLQEEQAKLEAEGNQLIQRHQAGMPQIGFNNLISHFELHITQFIEYGIFLERLKKQRELNNQNETNIGIYSISKEMYERYVSAFAESSWLGYKSAKLLAKTMKFNLYILRKKSDLDKKLELIDFYETPHAATTYYMLHTSGFTHFNLLAEASVAQITDKTSLTDNLRLSSASKSVSGKRKPVSQLLDEGIQWLKDQKINKSEEAFIQALYQENLSRLQGEGPTNYQVFIECFEYLAEITIAKANNIKLELETKEQQEEKDERLSDYHKQIGDHIIKALMLLNAALKLIKDHNIPSMKEKANALAYKIKSAQILFLKKIGDANREFVKDEKLDENYRSQWEKIREVSESGLKEINACEVKAVDDHAGFFARAKVVRATYIEVANEIKALLAEMIKECISYLGEPPCDYAFICFGSLAKKSATFCSDAELGLLLGEGKDTAANKRYFRNLSYLLTMRVINLGQTAMPFNMFKVGEVQGINFDSLLIPGFQMDLGGKTPLGRGDKKYDLIQTPTKMVKYIEDPYFKVDKFLPIELMGFDYLYGSEKLVGDYDNLVKEKLFKSGLYRNRAIKILYDGLADLPSNLYEFQTHLGENDQEGRVLYNVKKDIYRLPDRLVEGLALFWGVDAKSLWEKLDALEGKLNSRAINHCKIICSIAEELRLTTYLKNKGQQEIFSVRALSALSPEEVANELNTIFKINDINFLRRFYYTVSPLHKTLLQLCTSKDSEESMNKMLNAQQFFDDSFYNRALIAMRSLSYEEARADLEKWCKQSPRDPLALYVHGIVLGKLGRLRGAIEYISKAINYAKLASAPDFGLAEMHNNLAISYRLAGQYHMSLEIGRRGAGIAARCFGRELNARTFKLVNLLSDGIFVSYMGLSTIVESESEKIKFRLLAIKGLKEILWNNENKFPFLSDFDRARIYHNLASCYSALNSLRDEEDDLKQAMYYSEQARQIRKSLYGDENHPDVGLWYNNQGSFYQQFGLHHLERGEAELASECLNKAYYYFQKSVVMQKAVYKTEYHANVAGPLFNLACFFFRIRNASTIDIKDKKEDLLPKSLQERLLLARDYAEKALKIRLRIYKDQPHVDKDKTVELLNEIDHILNQEAMFSSLCSPLVTALLQEKKENGVRAIFEKYQINFDDVEIHRMLSHRHYLQHNILGSILHSEIALRLAIKNKWSLRQVAGLHHNLGCYYHCQFYQLNTTNQLQEAKEAAVQAKQHFKQGADLAPQEGIYTEYANYLLQQNQVQEAIDELKKALEAYQALSDKQKTSGLSYSKVERLTLDSNLQEELDFWGKLEIKAIYLTHYLLVNAYLRQGNEPAAKEALVQFQKEADATKEPLIFSFLGHAYFLSGDYEKSLTSYQRALSLKPSYSLVQQQIGKCYEKLGRAIPAVMDQVPHPETSVAMSALSSSDSKAPEEIKEQKRKPDVPLAAGSAALVSQFSSIVSSPLVDAPRSTPSIDANRREP